jgi:hypothetical protein
MKDKTVRNAEYYYRLITDGGQLFSEAKQIGRAHV